MNYLQRIADALPLRVEGIEISDPVLTMFGQEWSLSLLCPWTLSTADGVVSWDALDARVNSLVGRTLISVIGNDDLINPEFHFDGGVLLDVEADTDEDPWVFSLPDIVILGAMRQAGRPEA